MADYAVTSSSVAPGAGAIIDNTRYAGVAIVAGQVAYLELSSNTYKVCNASASAPLSKAAGIALNSAAVGQPVSVQTGGFITITATPAFTTRSPLVASGAGAGNMAPAADLVTNIATWWPAVLGIPVSATSILLQPLATQV